MDLTGRVALITGAAKGIGAACAERLSELGAVVVGVDVDDEQGRDVFARLGAPHQYRHLDVSDQEAWQALMRAVIAQHGALDIVHLNAGVLSRPEGSPMLDDPLDSFTLENYRRVMQTNVDGVVLGLLAVLDQPELSPRIFVTSSMAALNFTPQDPSYTASKSALLGLCLALRPSLRRRGIEVDVLLPLAIDTVKMAPDIRAVMKEANLEIDPPSFVADAIVERLASAPPANDATVWLSLRAADGTVPYEIPDPGKHLAPDGL